MMRLQVTKFNNEPVAQPLSADFDEMGGSIGRSGGNTLVLPDNHRYISRTQASIRHRGGKYLLRDAGSATPTYVNETAVGNGNEIQLNDGDELRIGEYTLKVSIQAAAAARDKRTGPLVTEPMVPRADRAARAQQPDSIVPPFGLDNVFERAPEPHVIPHDFDPLADLTPFPGQSKPLIPGAAGLGAAAPSVDDLFGLKQPSSWDPLGPQDPLSGEAHGNAHDLGGDPLALGLGGAGVESSRQASSAQRDDAPPLSGAFRPPQARRDQPEGHRDAPIIPADEPLHEGAPGMVFSWDAPPSTEAQDEIRSVIVPAPVETDALRDARKDRRPAPAPARVAAERAQAPAASEAPARVPVPGDELLEALLRGAGTAQLRIPDGLTPELMQLIGGLLRESIAGTLQLLLARALTKREVRAEATLIVATENNPLKFSPTVEAALAHLLASNGPGFMPPVTAVRDAYNDLRSHQFGIMAGMRAALASVLARFNPHELEKRLTDKRGLSALLPSSRKAKLWELYEQLYSDISREAEDDFQALFGREFLKAYEAQIQKLEQQDG